MNRTKWFLAGSAVVIALSVGGCSSSNSASSGLADAGTLDETLDRYEKLILKMDNDGLADLFAEDGELVNPGEPVVKGREAIRKFLKTFTEYKVLEESMHADSTVIMGTKAMQVVHFHQKVTIPNGQTLDVSGRIKINWVARDGKWFIIREETLPKD